MDSLLRRSPYNLRPRTVRVTAYQTFLHAGQRASVLQGDLDTCFLAAQAQSVHERYLAGDIQDDEDPEVEGGSHTDEYCPSDPQPSRDSPSASTVTQSPASPIATQNTVPPTATPIRSRPGRTKAYSKQKRRDRRVVEGNDARYSPYVHRRTKQCAQEKKKKAEDIQTEFAWSRTVGDRRNRVAKSASIGVRLRDRDYPREPIAKEEALRMGLDEINWDGDHDITIADAEGRVIVYLARRSVNMNPILGRVENQFKIASELYKFKPSQVAHRRGNFKSTPSGASYGGGQQRVGNLKDTAHNREILERHLLHNKDVINLAGFVDSIFQNAAREMHAEYGRILSSICDSDPSIQRNFANSVFAGVTFNFGPQASTVPHTDHLNIPTGWCAVVALGDFNADEGGHLILWDLNLLIRFPRGAVIFLPSALLVHSNTAVPQGQRRYSFTQYTAGGLARWVECGHMSQKDFLARGHQFARTPQMRWEDGLRRFPTMAGWRDD